MKLLTRRSLLKSAVAASAAAVATTTASAIPALTVTSLPTKFDAEAFVADMEAFGDSFYLGPKHTLPRRGWWHWFDPSDPKRRAYDPAYETRLRLWMCLYHAEHPRAHDAMIAFLERREAAA